MVIRSVAAEFKLVILRLGLGEYHGFVWMLTAPSYFFLGVDVFIVIFFLLLFLFLLAVTLSL